MEEMGVLSSWETVAKKLVLAASFSAILVNL